MFLKHLGYLGIVHFDHICNPNSKNKSELYQFGGFPRYCYFLSYFIAAGTIIVKQIFCISLFSISTFKQKNQPKKTRVYVTACLTIFRNLVRIVKQMERKTHAFTLPWIVASLKHISSKQQETKRSDQSLKKQKTRYKCSTYPLILLITNFC